MPAPAQSGSPTPQPSRQSLLAEPAPVVTHREFDDIPAIRKSVEDGVYGALSTLPETRIGRHALRLTDVRWSGPSSFTPQQHKEAVLSGGTLARQIKGTWRLYDAEDGRELAKRQTLVAQVPWVTPLGTVVYRGNDYTIRNQLRLLPGVYSRRKKNQELESHVNLLPGQGVSHRYFLDPETAEFNIRIRAAKSPLLPFLKALGVSDQEIQDAWGPDVYASNRKLDTPRSLKTVYERLVRRPDPLLGPDAQAAALRAESERMKLDPEVSRRTLGQPYDRVTGQAVLAATRRLLAIQRGVEDVDDRDHPAFQRLVGPEDLFSERITNDYGRVRQAMLRRAALSRNLDFVPAGVLTRQLNAVLQSSGLASPSEEINPTEILDKITSVTRMGEGGLPSTDAIPDEAREVNAAQLGVLEPVRTPESLRAGVDIYAARGARKGSDGKIRFNVKDVRTGESRLASPGELMDATVAFPGEMARVKPEERDSAWVSAVQGPRVGYVPAKEVTHELDDFEEAFNHLGNLIPLKSASKAHRMSMGSRMSVTGDTEILVWRESGAHYRGPISGYFCQPGDLAISIDKSTNQMVWRPVRRVVGHELDRPLYRVTLKSGRHVDATHDHSFVTLGQDGFLRKIHTQDLRPGLPVPRVGTLPVDDLTPRTTVWAVPDGNKHNARPGRSFELTRELGWIHGLYLAEGNTTSKVVSFANVATAIQDRVVGFFSNIGVRAHVRSGRSDGRNDRIVVGWKQFGVRLVSDFGTGAYKKRVPGWVFFAPREYREGLLAGYLAGDGEEHKRGDRPVGARARGGSRSRDLAWGMAQIAQTLGIDSTLTVSEADAHEPDRRLRGRNLSTKPTKHYRFHVRCEHIRLLPKTGHPGKDATWGDPTSWSGTRSADWIPMFSSLRSAIMAGSCRGHQAREYVYRDRHTRTSVVGLLGDSAAEHSLGWSGSGVWWDKVESVVEIPAVERTVYDLDMADNVFACNGGVFVHNTTQALPLIAPESPLVQSGSKTAGGESFESLYGRHAGAVKAAKGGVVTDVKPGEVMRVRYEDGTTGEFPLYSAFPYNRKSGIDMTSRLAPGQRFQARDVLVTSNYTDQDGRLALGLNLRTAYMPFKGLNYEDAVVVSESAAKRLSSDHMYQHRHDHDDAIQSGRSRYIGLFPKQFDRRQLEQVDDDGVVRPGLEVQPGDPLVLAVKKMIDPAGRLHRKSAATWQPAHLTWDHEHPGVVTDVMKDKKGVSVVVRSHNELRVADKLSGRFGDKGVVAAIIPDDRMPRDKQGRPVEVIMNELGLISRANSSQVAETILGKIAADKLGGKPYVVRDFEDIEDVSDWARQEAERHGVPVEEDLEDPESGASIPGILTGNRFVMKLSHTAESKGQARGTGGYTMEEAPAKGGGEGGKSKRISLLNVNAILSSGAVGVLKDASLVRGQKNPEYWLDFMQGKAPRDPEVPMIHQKLVAELQASGINVVPEGRQLHIMALLDHDVDELAGSREVTNRESGRMVDGVFTPTSGGLFDDKLVGPDGDKWAKITFPEQIPNPVMEEPIRRLLGLTEAGLEEVIQGTRKLPSGETGPAGLKKALESINVKKELMTTRLALKTAKSSARDGLLRKLGYLKAADRLDIHPRDWMVGKAAVLPARFRPIAVMEDSGLPLVSDANWLYRELLEARDNLKTMSEKSSDVGDERLALYRAHKAVVGLGDPLHPKLREKGISGILKTVFGSNPKTSIVQQKLIGSTVDLVGRGVVVPNPDLDMDSLGIPENKAWEIYRMHVIRRLKRRGMPLGRAIEETEKKSDLARKEMLSEMDERPIMMDRAPVLHRFGEMAFWPKLTKDEAVHVSPLVIQGFGMDFDGDAVQYHVPGTDEAAREMAERMLPSRNLVSPADFKRPMHVPIREYALGLYLGSRKPENSARAEYFEDEDAAIQAFRRGEIRYDHPIEIPDKKRS